MTIRRTTYFMQICERLIATLCHANSLFLVIYEVFIRLVVQSFCAKKIAWILYHTLHFGELTKSQVAAACLCRPSLKRE